MLVNPIASIHMYMIKRLKSVISVLCSLLLIFLASQAFPQAKHDPLSQEKDIVAFEKADKVRRPPRRGTLFTGSSSIRLWDDLDRRFPKRKVINRGFGGAWLSDLVYYFDRVIVPYQPKKIVIYAGENDIAGGKSAEELAKDFESLFTLWRQKLPRSKLIFISLKPSPARFDKIAEIQKANELIKQRLQNEKRAVFIDVFTPMLGPDGKPREELFKEDRLHMNIKGYNLWEPLIRPFL